MKYVDKYYVSRIRNIKNQINLLIDELWDNNENRKTFTYNGLTKRVYDDITYGINLWDK